MADNPASGGPSTTIDRVNSYETIMPLLTAMFQEFTELSKRKPEGVLNKTKIKVVNRLLEDALTVLEDESTRGYLDLIDEDEVPQNSDVLLMLSQFKAAMIAFKARYYWSEGFGPARWHTEER